MSDYRPPKPGVVGSNPAAPTSPENTDRFWSKVDRNGGPTACWPWVAYRGTHGYGLFRAGGTGRNATPQRAHRVSFEMANGPVPAGRVVLHSCDNKACVNPAHLSAGTQAENAQQAVERGLVTREQLLGRLALANATRRRIHRLADAVAAGRLSPAKAQRLALETP